MRFNNNSDAFAFLYDKIMEEGFERNGTKELYNISFTIEDVSKEMVVTPIRRTPRKYAELEWEWYQSEDPNAEEISKHAKIWVNHMDENGDVRSNYGHQFSRNDAWRKVREQLEANPNTRQAVLTVHDSKEKDAYQYDTPCCVSMHFQIIDGKLCASTVFRSLDLVYGFCNDVVMMTRFQKKMAIELGIQVGWHHWFSSNIHIYERHWNLASKSV